MDVTPPRHPLEPAGPKIPITRIMVLGGITLLLGLGWLTFQYEQVRKWESATATVLSVESITSSSTAGQGSPSTNLQTNPTL